MFHQALINLGIIDYVLNGDEPTNAKEFKSRFTSEETITWDIVKEEITRLETLKAATQYRKDRQTAYPTVGEQLGLLFDDIKAGNLEKGKWVKLIEDIKSAHPKPQTQA